jgi:hypothetical protein
MGIGFLSYLGLGGMGIIRHKDSMPGMIIPFGGGRDGFPAVF